MSESDTLSKVGRPRAFASESMFHATTHILVTQGYSALTLEAVARQAGCSAAAVSKRFGSKKGMLSSYLLWTQEQVRARFAQARANYASPLDALIARYSLPFDERPEEFGAMPGWLEMSEDEDFTELASQTKKLWLTEVEQSLADASAIGELVDCNIQDAAWIVVTSLVGVTIMWDAERDGDFIAEVSRTLQLILLPLRINAKHRTD
jgi:AcrR family transcriptional regulator